MAERCSLVSTESPRYDNGFVFDAGIPGSCWSCLNAALANEKIPKAVEYTDLSAEDFPGLDFPNADRNTNYGIRRNGERERSGLIEQTIDIDGSQYDNVECIVRFEFDCQKAERPS